MKKHASLLLPLLIVCLFSLSFQNSFAQGPPPDEYISDQDGDWETDASWDTDEAPNCNVTKDITIHNDITCGCDPLDVTGPGSLTVKSGGKLVVTSDAGVTGSGSLIIENGAEVEIRGDLSLNGTGTMTVDGDLTVDGDVTKGGSATFDGSGTVSIGGSGCDTWTGSGDCTDGAALPIELISFNAELTEDKNVKITWATAAEINNDYFTIERSVNGLSFEAIGEVTGAGESRDRLDYEFIDDQPQEGTMYYQLKQTDFDGQYEVFDMVAVTYEVKSDGSCVLKVYPNPCPGSCNIALSECDDFSNAMMEVYVYDAAGNRVFSKVPYRSSTGSFSFHMNTSNNLAPGIYVVKAASGKEGYSEKMIVK